MREFKILHNIGNKDAIECNRFLVLQKKVINCKKICSTNNKKKILKFQEENQVVLYVIAS